MFRSLAVASRSALRALSTDAAAANWRRLPCQADSLLALGTREIYDSDHDLFRVRVVRIFSVICISIAGFVAVAGCCIAACRGWSAILHDRSGCCCDLNGVQESARKFFDNEVIPHHAKWEEEGHVPRELWQAAGACAGTLSAAMLWPPPLHSCCHRILAEFSRGNGSHARQLRIPVCCSMHLRFV